MLDLNEKIVNDFEEEFGIKYIEDTKKVKSNYKGKNNLFALLFAGAYNELFIEDISKILEDHDLYSRLNITRKWLEILRENEFIYEEKEFLDNINYKRRAVVSYSKK